MAIWTIQGETGKALDATVRTLESIGANDAILERKCLGMDRLTWSVPCNLDGSGTISPEKRQKVTLFRDGVRYFTGHCTDNFPSMAGQGLNRNIEISGLWWWMTQIQISSDQQDQVGNIKERPVLVCDTGDLSTMITNVITRAIALGLPAALGTIATTASIVRVTLPNSTVADALTELMRWIADGMLWVDYAPATPKIYVTRRLAGLAVGSATTKTLVIGVDDIGSPALRSKIGLQVAQVVIPYATRDVQGRALYQVQQAGTFATGQRQIIPVAGPELDTVLPRDLFDSVKVKSATTLPSGSLNSLVLTTYDQQLKSSGASGFAIGPKTWTTFPSGTYVLPAVTTTVEKKDGGALPVGRKYFLTQAEPPDWWIEDGIGWETARCQATVWTSVNSPDPIPVGYTPAPPPWVEKMGCQHAAFREINPATGVARQVDVYYTTIAVTFPVVDTLWAAETTIYRKEDYSYLNPPAGMAAYLLAAQAWEPIQGTVPITELELPATPVLGQCLNITGGPPEWSAMRAPIQGVTMNLNLATSTIQVGAPDRLSYSALVARFRRTGQDNLEFIKGKPLNAA